MSLDNVTQSLLVAAKLGDEKAINLLFARHQSKILRIVRFRLTKKDRERLKLQSMDIVQEVFMYAFQHLKDFEPQSQGHFLNWLSMKVQHCIIDRFDYFDRNKRKAEGGEIYLDQPLQLQDNSDQVKIEIKDDRTTPSQFAVRQEREQLIDSLLELLPVEERELIIHRDLEELTFKEIGDMLGKTEDAARKQYCRTFKKLLDLSEERLKPIIAEESLKDFKNAF